MPEEPEGYADLERSATIAKVSTKTIRNWARAGRIGQQRWPGTAKVVYNVEDILRELAKSAEMTITQNPAGAPLLAGMGNSIAAAVAAATEPRNEAIVLENREVLTLDEAALLSGYGRGVLEQAIAMGKLPAKRAGRHGSIVIRRADLAGLWELIG